MHINENVSNKLNTFMHINENVSNKFNAFIHINEKVSCSIQPIILIFSSILLCFCFALIYNQPRVFD